MLSVAENVVDNSSADDTARSLAPQQVLLHAVDHASSLKLIKDKRFNARAWLIPFAVVTTIVIVGYLLYNKLSQLLLDDFFQNFKVKPF